MDIFFIAVILLIIISIVFYLLRSYIKELLQRCLFGPKLRHKKGVVILYQVGRGPRAPSISPFPLKLETFIRMANIPYMNDHNGHFSSKGKTPWMEYDGVAVADSQFCVEYLKQERQLTLDQHLAEEQKALARALQKMTEENLYWTMCSETFFKESSMSELQKLLPYGPCKRWFVLKTLKLVLRKEMWGHGIGRHTPEEIWRIGQDDMRAISNILGDKQFFMGDEPTEVDCSMFGMLAQIRWHMRGSKHEKYMIGNLPNLVDYCERMRQRFWPDWDQRITSSEKFQNDHGHMYSDLEFKCDPANNPHSLKQKSMESMRCQKTSVYKPLGDSITNGNSHKWFTATSHVD